VDVAMTAEPMIIVMFGNRKAILRPTEIHS
jgi:hypothetical protein